MIKITTQGRELKEKRILIKMDFEETLKKLFDEPNTVETIGHKHVYKKIKKLEIGKEINEELDLEDQLQKIITEGNFFPYLPGNLIGKKVFSEKIILFRGRIEKEYLGGSEIYTPYAEKLLNVHLQFPSMKEIANARTRVHTCLKYLLSELQKNKGTRRLYDGIRFYRMVLLAKQGLINYIFNLPTIVNDFEKIVRTKTGDIETEIIMNYALTTFEKRILAKGDYISANDKDFERQHLSLALSVYFSVNKNFEETGSQIKQVFSYDEFIKSFSPYELLFFSLKISVLKRLEGRYIFIRNGSEDWGWYYLDSISPSGKNQWKLDVWMDNLVLTLDPLLYTCINLYEKLFVYRFQDREYRVHEKNCEGLEADMRTLLKNISILSNRKGCSQYLRKQLSDKLTYRLTENDLLDRRSPDLYVFNTYDKITPEDIEMDWRNVQKRIYFNFPEV